MARLTVNLRLLVSQNRAIFQADRADLASETSRVEFCFSNFQDVSLQCLSTPSTVTKQFLKEIKCQF